MPILIASGISHTYPTPNGPLRALDNISLSLAQDEFLCLVGPSGCGKSTLLRILSGLLAPTQGTAAFDGQPILAPHPRIRLVFQQANLMPWRTAIENIALPLELAGVGRTERENAARRMVSLVGLSGFEAAYPALLSGGMAQRVALARALIEQPQVLLLDEPFGALDALTREVLRAELLRILEAEKRAALMVTHSIPEAILLADRVLVMSPRPGAVDAVFEIGLPRPRTPEMMYSPLAGELAAAIRAALRLDLPPARE